jgi:Glycosyltransferase family 87
MSRQEGCELARLAPRAVRWATVALLAALVASYSAWLTWSVTTNQWNDFAVYYLSGQLYAQHGSPYTVTRVEWKRLAAADGITHYAWPYRYPPHTAALVRLLVPLGASGAEVVWGIGSALALIGGALLLARTLGGGWRTPAALLALLVFMPAYHTLQGGQVNAFVFAALVAALWGLTRRRDWALGAGVAIGAALKITPLALLVYLVWQRRWRATLAAVASLAGLSLVLLPITGIHTYVEYASSAFALTRPELVSVSPGIDTVRAFIGRLVLPGSESALTGTGADVASAATVVVVLLAAMAAALLWRRQRENDGTGALAAPYEFSLVVALSLVAPFFTYYHQYVLLLIPFMVAVNRLWEQRRRGLLALLALLVVLVDAEQPVWAHARTFVLAHGLWRALTFPFLLAVVLMVVCTAAVWDVRWRSVVVRLRARFGAPLTSGSRGKGA